MTEARRADETALVREVARGHEDALAVLYDRHVDGVYAAAMRLTDDRGLAEEVVQETFLALWNRAELFDPHAGSLAAWLHTISRNRAVDRLRAAGRRPSLVSLTMGDADDDPGSTLERAVGDRPVLGGADLGPGPERALEGTELRSVLRDALAEMPDQERAVILLAYGEGLTQTEIAGRTGWPLGTVKTRTRRGLARLRRVLEPDYGPRPGPDARPVVAADGARDR
jgi:RNA polymerase sigma-70 factor (ECF subfamily)